MRDIEAVLEVADVDPDRRAQHAELPAARRGRAQRPPGAAQARPVRDARGAADGRRVHPQGGQRERDALRARDPHVRDRLPLHARPDGRAGAQGAHAPAGDRRPQPRRRAARPGRCRCRWPPPRRAPTGSSSRSTRTPTRRSATARRRCARTGSPTTPRASSRPRRSPARRSAPREPRCSGVRVVAVLGVGLIGGSIGLAARERLGRRRVAATTPTRRCSSARCARGAIDAARPGRCRRGRRRRGGVRRRAGRRAARGASRRRSRAAPRGLRGQRRRLDQARRGRRRRATSASSAATRSPAPRPPGCEHARADLFDGATWYLTPGAERPPACSTSACTGCSPASARSRRRSTPTTHDRLMARVSHLPHVLANVLVAQAARRAAARASACPRPARASATRPAWPAPTARSGPTSTSPTATRWSPASTTRIARLGEVRGALLAAATAGAVDALERRARAPTATALLGRRRSPAAPVHELRASVPNRPGVVADIALALGRAGVNIVDMALSPVARQRPGRGRAVDAAARSRRARAERADRRARLPGGARVTR